MPIDGTAVGLCTVGKVIETTTGDKSCGLHEIVDGVIDGFDAVCVVDCELGIIWGLNGLVDDSIDYAKGVHSKFCTVCFARSNQLVLVVEIFVESGTIMTTV